MNRVQGAQGLSEVAVGVRGGNSSRPASYTRLNRLTVASAHKGDAVSGDMAVSVMAGADGNPHPAIQVFDRLPEGFLGFKVPDHSCEPLIRQGEIAVIDPADRDPVYGALYLRRTISGNGGARLRVVENVFQMWRPAVLDGEPSLEPCSVFVSYNRPRSAQDCPSWSRRFGIIPMADGPFRLDRPCARPALDSLVGRVVGIVIEQGARQ